MEIDGNATFDRNILNSSVSSLEHSVPVNKFLTLFIVDSIHEPRKRCFSLDYSL